MSKISRFYILLCWAVVILILISFPMPEYEGTKITLYDKVVHAFLFGIFSYLVVLSLIPFRNKNFRLSFIILISSALGTIYSGVCEYIQIFVPGRTVSEYDFLGGLAGVVIASFISYALFKKSKEEVLLHVCCAVCAVYICDFLNKDFTVIPYFYNPNIFPESEYLKRLNEVKKIAKIYSLNLLIGEYNHVYWLKEVRGKENDREGGERCSVCYRCRLDKLCKIALEKGIRNFTTTLSVSPVKKYIVINQIGNELAEKYDLTFIDKDFKKKDGFKKSIDLSKEFKLYRQSYCGCEFSIR